ncbi:acyltransferase [Rufibacter sp. LB8]|uniref:acyltransferase family protein n=1 Tax=Rufibacter sp. LB8 TaxID=2777781 RepID=UPI00178C3646|nr:acyltransferase [Rufibacter sp. LB8]
MQKKIHFQNLDGIRTVAFFAVFLCHSGYTEFNSIKESSIYKLIKFDVWNLGHIGVNLFFVLSGFLITYLLLIEENTHARINIPKFYMRRILRIWPLYFFCVFFGFIIFPQLKTIFNQTPNETANILYFITFLSNFNTIQNGTPDSSVLSVLWSVSIEEQFYLFWPILIILFKKYRPFLFVILILFSLVFRYSNLGNNTTLDLHTFSAINDLSIGGLFAWLSYNSNSFIKSITNLNKPKIIIFYIIGFLVIAMTPHFENFAILQTFERLILSIFFIFIILEQNFSENSFYKFSNFKTITKWGKYTYGLYCLHFIGILIATNTTKLLKINTSLPSVLILDTILALSITMCISWISYNYFEKKFLKLKTKFDTHVIISHNSIPDK